jgi:hypothetical protein
MPVDRQLRPAAPLTPSEPVGAGASPAMRGIPRPRASAPQTPTPRHDRRRPRPAGAPGTERRAGRRGVPARRPGGAGHRARVAPAASKHPLAARKGEEREAREANAAGRVAVDSCTAPGNLSKAQHTKPRRSGAFVKRMMGLEPTTFCMASASDRSHLFASVRSNRLCAGSGYVRANGSEPERTPKLAILATASGRRIWTRRPSRRPASRVFFLLNADK